MGDNHGARHNGLRKAVLKKAERQAGRLTLQQAMAIEPEDDADNHLLADDDNDLVDVPQRALRP